MKPTPKLNAGDLVAIGDVHGQIDLLSDMVDLLLGTGVNLLFLGDLIDRATQPGGDAAVLDLVKQLMDDPQSFGLSSVEALRGNHEDMFLAALKTRTRYDMIIWAQNGGDLESIEALAKHESWLKKLPYYKRVGTTVFVHAGLMPGLPLSKQSKGDMVWIRQPFLNAKNLDVKGVKFVVHGHTPNFKGHPVLAPNRLGIDTGAFKTGILTGYNHGTGETFQVCRGA